MHPAWEIVECRKCGGAAVIGELPGRQFRLLDAEPTATSSGYRHVPAGRVMTPRFVATSASVAFRCHWDGCRALTGSEREFVERYDEFDRARPAVGSLGNLTRPCRVSDV